MPGARMTKNDITCKWVKLARKRQQRDLAEGAERGLWFDAQSADRVVKFFAELRHYKGQHAGKAFILEPWQSEDIIHPLFGWRNLPEGMTAKDAERIDISKRALHGITRRYRTAYISMARKNGKSAVAGGICDYGMMADFERGAEIYSVATKRDQAAIVWNLGKKLIKGTRLDKHLTFYKSSIVCEQMMSSFEPLSSDAKRLDGHDPHIVSVDEYHAHRDNSILSVMETGQGNRIQPLTTIITTSGLVRECACYDEEQNAKAILEGTIENDLYFAIIYTLDDGDDYTDPRVWPKSNPNLGVTVQTDYLEKQVAKAQRSESDKNQILTKNFNIWTDSKALWIDTELWDSACKGVDPIAWRKAAIEDLKGCDCYAGLDLGGTSDLTSFVMMFPQDTGPYKYIPLRYTWVPEDCVTRRENRATQSYQKWVAQDMLIQTPGAMADYDRIRHDINELAEHYNIKRIAADRLFQGAQLCSQLMEGDGFDLVAFGQGFVSMAYPVKLFEELVLDKKIDHGNDPLLRWEISHVMVKLDPAGNKKPDKKESADKIDDLISMIMGLALADQDTGEAEEFTILYD